MNIDCSHTPTSIDGHQDQVETTQCGKQEAEAKGAAIEIWVKRHAILLIKIICCLQIILQSFTISKIKENKTRNRRPRI